MRLELRDYTQADRDALAWLWHESWQGSGLATERDPHPEDYAARLDDEGRDWLIRLAWLDGAIVGFVALHPAVGRVRQLFVAPSSQRRGVATRLIDEARRAMPGGFWLRTDRDNRPARSLYAACGLRLEGEAPSPRSGDPMAIYRWP